MFCVLLMGLLQVVFTQCTGGDSGDSAEMPGGGVNPERQPTEVRHPIEDALLSNSTDAPVHDLAFSDLEALAADRFSVLARFPAEGAVGSLGMMSDDTTQVLGEIVDGLILPPGSPSEVALLDQSYGVVRTFAPDGTPLATFGGIGEGPGELTWPAALGYAGGSFLVLDAAMKVEQYGWNGAEWEPASRIPLPMDAQDLCPLRDGLALIGMRTGDDGMLGTAHDPRAVHILSSSDGEISSSFSAPYSYDGVLALWYMMRGKLACDAGRGRVWVAYETLGEVHALDLDGTLLWIARLTDMVTPKMVEMEGEAIRGDTEEGQPIEIISNISLLDGSALAVQVTSALFQRGGEDDQPNRTVSYRTYLMDAESGRGLGGFRGSHRVLGGGGGRAILYRDDPFPQFAVVPLGGG
jgi:hypothetical protein